MQRRRATMALAAAGVIPLLWPLARVQAQIYAPNAALTFSPELTVVETDQRAAFNANPNGGTPATVGFSNLALPSGGGVAFESTRIAAPYGDDKLNNGVYGVGLPDVDDATRPWISGGADVNGFAGVQLASASDLEAIGFGSRFPSRSDGLFTLQYTTDSFGGVDLESAAQTGALSWNTIGTLTSTTTSEFGRHLVAFDEVIGATGVRIVVDQPGTTITEIEVYDGFNAPDPPPPADAPAAPTAYTTAVLSDNPLHYYRFEETHIQQSAKDAVGTPPDGDQPGSFQGGITAGVESAYPNLGLSADFDGTSGTLVSLGSPFHPASGAITVEAWVNLNPLAAETFLPIAARWDGSYELDVNNTTAAESGQGRLNLVSRNDGTNTFGVAASADPMEKGVWHHVAGVFELGKLKVYIDGSLVGESDTGEVATLQDAGTTLFIGSTRDGSAFNWNGRIDEVAFYGYALSEGQIDAHIAAAVPEPSSLILIALAVTGVVATRGRRVRR